MDWAGDRQQIDFYSSCFNGSYFYNSADSSRRYHCMADRPVVMRRHSANLFPRLVFSREGDFGNC